MQTRLLHLWSQDQVQIAVVDLEPANLVGLEAGKLRIAQRVDVDQDVLELVAVDLEHLLVLGELGVAELLVHGEHLLLARP